MPNFRAFSLAYNALLQISCVDENLRPPQQCLQRVHHIASAALKELNTKHTDMVREVFGIEEHLKEEEHV